MKLEILVVRHVELNCFSNGLVEAAMSGPIPVSYCGTPSEVAAYLGDWLMRIAPQTIEAP